MAGAVCFSDRVTDLELDNDERDLDRVLRSVPGGDVAKAIFEAGLAGSVVDLKEKLTPYRCGFIRRPTVNQPASDLVFTEEDVGWHEFISTRMYTIIEGNVYDVTRQFAWSVYREPRTC
jgi:hypothetical protein